tara:strand:- start:134 stop:415 length:282 start_codon:yes stop_codon:yes gene_type:complete
MTGVETKMDDAFGSASRLGPSLATEPSSTRRGQSTAFQDNVKAMLGNKIALGGVLSGGIDLREGYPHSTTGQLRLFIHTVANSVFSNDPICFW